MRGKIGLAGLVLVAGFSSRTASADGTLVSWSPSEVPGVTQEIFNEAKRAGVDEILKKNLEVRSWADAFLLVVGARAHKEDKTLRKGLIAQATNKATVRLKETKRLIIWERITSGEIQFEGKGFQVSDDLFSVAGRANWMLRLTTDKNFGYVKPKSSQEELAGLQQAWTRWSNGERVEEYKDRYTSEKKGLDELRSPEAIEALVAAMKPSKAKEKAIKECQDGMKDNDGPGALNAFGLICDPDNLIYIYLGTITGIKEKHDYPWWKDWWDKSKDKLEWNAEEAQFTVKK